MTPVIEPLSYLKLVLGRRFRLSGSSWGEVGCSVDGVWYGVDDRLNMEYGDLKVSGETFGSNGS